MSRSDNTNLALMHDDEDNIAHVGIDESPFPIDGGHELIKIEFETGRGGFTTWLDRDGAEALGAALTMAARDL